MRRLYLVKKSPGAKAKKTDPTKAELLSLKLRYDSTLNRKERLYKRMDAMLALNPDFDNPEWLKKFEAMNTDWKAAMIELRTLETEILQRAGVRA